MKSKLMCAIVLFLFTFGLFPSASPAAQYKVLVVMSYGEEFPWVVNIREKIDAELGGDCDIKYFYMDTKKNVEGGPAKAEEAFRLFLNFQPDGVIAADDNAQSMFVVPYLKDKVKTPVMFCGVNAAPEKYGYPASNISGILERQHYAESLSLVKQLVPSVETFGYIVMDNITGKANEIQIKEGQHTFPVKLAASRRVTTFKEAEDAVKEFKPICDALCILSLQALKDENGMPVSQKKSIPHLAGLFGKPTFGDNGFLAEYGLLCSVAKTGWEQGEVAARMLRKAMTGTPVSEIPVTRNQNGRVVVNVEVMKELGIKPSSNFLQQVELVKTIK